MNEDEIKKCKEDVVYFTEKYLGLKLIPWQKLYLKAFQKEQDIEIMGKRAGKKVLYESMIAYRRFLLRYR